MKPCSFNGVYQPSLLDTFPNGKILLLSYFYDRIQPLLADSPSASPIKVSTLATLADQLCRGKSSWKDHWGFDDALMFELEDRPEWCLDMTFMHALLRLGYEFGTLAHQSGHCVYGGIYALAMHLSGSEGMLHQRSAVQRSSVRRFIICFSPPSWLTDASYSESDIMMRMLSPSLLYH